MNNSQLAANRALERVFRQREHLHIVDWADQFFWLPPASSNNKEMMKWRTYGYQKFILHSFADLDTQQTVVKKPTQVGLSKCALIGIGYESAHRSRSNGIWLPSRGDANTFSNVQISDMLQHVKEVRDQLTVDYDKKDKDNTSKRRAYKGAQSYCFGTQTLQDVSSVAVDHVFGDEVSKYPQVLRGGKDDKGKAPVDGLKGRLDSSTDPCISLLSTCTEHGVCQISEEFEGCREQWYRGYFCPCCKSWQVFDWGTEKTVHGFKWIKQFFDDGSTDDLMTAKTGYYQCGNEDCDHQFKYEDLDDLDDHHGEWRSEKLRFDEHVYKYYSLETGEEVESPHSNGIQVRGWMNRRKPWWQGIYDFLGAVRGLAEGKSGKMVDWTQDYESMAYRAAEEADYVRHGYLMAKQEDCIHDPSMGVHDEVQMITKFWDVQGDRIECLTTGWSIGNECWLIDHNVYWGDPTKGSVLENIQRHTEKKYENQSGQEVPVFLSGVDTKYLPNVINPYCAGEYKFKIIPCMGSSSIGKPIVQGRTNANKDHGTFLTTLCPDTAKTQVYKMYKVETPGPGFIHIPDIDVFDEKFIKQMVAEVRKLKNGVYRWVCPEGVRNEALDLLCGNLAISIIAQQRLGFKFLSKEEYKNQDPTKDDYDFDMSAMIEAAKA